METAVESFFGMLLLEQSERADGLDDVVFVAVGGGTVMNSRTGNDRETAGEALFRRHLIKTIRKQVSNAGIGADGNQAFGKWFEGFDGDWLALLSGDGTLVVGGAEVGFVREQTVEVVIAARRFDVEQQRLIIEAQFGSDNWLDAGALCPLGELRGAMQVADVGNRDGGQAVLFGMGDEGGGGKEGIEEGVVTAGAEGDVGGTWSVERKAWSVMRRIKIRNPKSEIRNKSEI